MTDLVPSTEMVFRGVETTPLALTFEHPLSAQMWDELMKTVLATRNASQWWLGDVLNAGDEWFGEEMAHFLELRHVSEITIKNVMRVCKVFPPARRRADLSFSHHMEVAGFDTESQDRLLTLASEKDLNRDAMRALVKHTKQKAKLIEREGSAQTTEGAETVEEAPEEETAPLAREPEVIEGEAEEVEPERQEEPFDDVESVLRAFMRLDPGSQKAVLLRAAEHVRLLLTHGEQTEIQEVADLVDDDLNPESSSDRAPGCTDGMECQNPAPQSKGSPAVTEAAVSSAADGASADHEEREKAGEVTRPSPPPAPELNASEDEALEIPTFLRRDSENNFVEPRDA